MLIVFDDMIADMEANKKFKPIVAESFMRGRKLNISLVFVSQSSFTVPKTIRLNVTEFFVMKIPNLLTHLSDIEFKDFMKLYKKSFPF